MPVLPSSAAGLLERCTFPPAGAVVTCAVSGGADSLGLLLLGVAAGCDVTAMHVDHAIRPGSAAEAAVVAAAAAAVGAGFRSVSAPVPAGPNLEARARTARYAVLPDDALLGHTMDDQAETMVLNLLRGAGTAGMAAMRHDGRRPLLRLRRAETRSLCREAGLDPVDDPSNVDDRFRRNRVRHELLDAMARVAERDVVPVLARQAELFAADADLLDSLAGALDPTDAATVRCAPAPVAARALRAWIGEVTGATHPPDAATTERALAVARLESRATDVGGGWRLARTDGVLRLESPAAGSSPDGEVP